MTRKLGAAASAVTLFGVFGFAVSMLFSFDGGSYLFSMFIALGFLPLICSLAAQAPEESKAFSFTSVGFSAVYVVFIMVVYFCPAYRRFER